MKSSEIESYLYGNLQLLERAPKNNGEQMDSLVKTIGITAYFIKKNIKLVHCFRGQTKINSIWSETLNDKDKIVK